MLQIENSIELNLEELRVNATKYSILELKKIEKTYRNNLKYLQGMLNYYKKQQNQDLNFIRTQIKEVKKAIAIIGEEKRKREEVKKSFGKNETSIIKKEDHLHLQELMQRDLSKEEKIKSLEEIILTLETSIEIYQEQNLELQDRKKEYLEFWLDYKSCRKCEQEIRENKIKINHLKQEIQKCRTYLIELKEIKVKKKRVKAPIIKTKKENRYYFLILEEFLKNDQNYFLVQELIQKNSHFLNSLNKISETLTEKEKDYFQRFQNANTAEKEKRNFLSLSLDWKILYSFMLDAINQKHRVNLIKRQDIPDWCFIGKTITLENQKYAFHYGYSEDFHTYFCIHVLDTSFIPEESIWYKEMEFNPLYKNKDFKKYFQFQEKNAYPTFTYQFTIAPNGKVESFKMYESVIRIDRKIKNSALFAHRNEEELKGFIRSIKFLMQEYGIKEDCFHSQGIEKIVDKLLNRKLVMYLQKYQLPAFYFTELERSEEEKQKEHSRVAYYLSKIPKKEVEDFIQILEKAKTSRFYSLVPLEESSIFLDTLTFIGYQQLCVLKAHSHNRIVNKMNSFDMFMHDLNQADSFIDSKTQLILKRKKITFEHK